MAKITAKAPKGVKTISVSGKVAGMGKRTVGMPAPPRAGAPGVPKPVSASRSAPKTPPAQGLPPQSTAPTNYAKGDPNFGVVDYTKDVTDSFGKKFGGV